MAKRKRQYTTYASEELGEKIEAAADEHGMSVAELLREGARRQLAQWEPVETVGGEEG